MFGKLIKNELKTGFHSIVGIYIAALVSCGLVIITMFFDNDINAIGKLIKVLFSFVPFIIALIAFVVVVVSTIINYNKSMYGQQGYLTFTLPVKSGTLYSAKMVSSFLWVLLGYVFILGSILLLFWYNGKDLSDGTESLVDTLLGVIGLSSLKVLVTSVFARLVVLCTSVFFFITVVMFSLTLGNTKSFQSNSVLMACLFSGAIIILSIILIRKVVNEYFGIYLITLADKIYFSREEADMVSTQNLAGTIFQILMIIGFSFGNVFLMKKKISVK